MHRRLPRQPLRGSDATLLEVQLQNLLRRPLVQLDAQNALDLLALAESPERPKSLARQIEQYVDRCANEVADMPAAAFAELLAEVEPLPPELVPRTFREWVASAAERSDRDAGQLQALLARWAEVEPEPFAIGQRAAKVQRATAAPPPVEPVRTGARAAREPAPPKAPPPPRLPTVGMDDETRTLLERICMERLNGATETGLAEVVLVAGVRHRAKTDGHGEVSMADVTAVLRGLKATNRVRFSAGRWMSTARRW